MLKRILFPLAFLSFCVNAWSNIIDKPFSDNCSDVRSQIIVWRLYGSDLVKIFWDKHGRQQVFFIPENNYGTEKLKSTEGKDMQKFFYQNAEMRESYMFWDGYVQLFDRTKKENGVEKKIVNNYRTISSGATTIQLKECDKNSTVSVNVSKLLGSKEKDSELKIIIMSEKKRLGSSGQALTKDSAVSAPIQKAGSDKGGKAIPGCVDPWEGTGRDAGNCDPEVQRLYQGITESMLNGVNPLTGEKLCPSASQVADAKKICAPASESDYKECMRRLLGDYYEEFICTMR
jgi:hypothetical protein